MPVLTRELRRAALAVTATVQQEQDLLSPRCQKRMASPISETVVFPGKAWVTGRVFYRGLRGPKQDQNKTGTSVTSAGDGSESAERLSRPPTVWLIRRQHAPRQDTRPPCAGASCRHAQKGGCRKESNGDKKMKLLGESICTLYLWQPQDFNLCERRNTPVFSGTPNVA